MRLRRFLAFAVAAGLACAAPAAAAAPAVPSPLRFASQLDLECFKTDPYTPPPTYLKTSHLNPVLANLPAEVVKLGNREQLCVPVDKNYRTPTPDVFPWVRFVDLSCYRIEGQPVGFPLKLDHLNPVLREMGIPTKVVKMYAPEQLCVPVIKNGVVPPAEVLRLVRYIDLKCYSEFPQQELGVGLWLRQLNPVLANQPPAFAKVRANRQLCVPVRKNDQVIPPDVLNVVRWIDLEKYDIDAPPFPNSVGLVLQHINPQLVNLPREEVKIYAPNQLALPVAKNGVFPPT
ncbi:hypothetical protein Lesp02_45460 [Lentzea sp. NBRC 105346]|uniref:hypothetical protein n=1 Tax=Lentzea sp. NBRC 105346 TaxID=3032205 RepID=UPI00249F9928|nr:hypothetical protein [Lentzea sp. NBRC 105346]GLZ32358.1 hypothetical protein Lesp02_45460 [Lentzea sp. NBRC 105346]